MNRRAPLIPPREEARAGTPAVSPVPSPIPAFADPRLRHARSDVLRATLARQAQGLIGNHAVANVLARSAPVAPATAPAAGRLMGEEVDAMIAGSPFFSTYIKPKADGGRLVAGRVHHHAHDEFQRLCIEYMKGKQNPDTKKTYTDEEAKAEAEQVTGFHDDAKDEIHVDQDNGDRVSVLHEAIHHYVHATWRAKTGRNVDEGVTECFTRRLCADSGTENKTPAYPKQFGAAFNLIDALDSWELVAAAYFNGEVIALANKVDDLGLKEPFGNFYEWVRMVNEGRYVEADALLVPAK